MEAKEWREGVNRWGVNTLHSTTLAIIADLEAAEARAEALEAGRDKNREWALASEAEVRRLMQEHVEQAVKRDALEAELKLVLAPQPEREKVYRDRIVALGAEVERLREALRQLVRTSALPYHNQGHPYDAARKVALDLLAKYDLAPQAGGREEERFDAEGQRYWLEALGVRKYVSREEWVRAERGAGFRPKGRDDGQPATGGFGTNNLSGGIEYEPPASEPPR